jgi:hypothetical protein
MIFWKKSGRSREYQEYISANCLFCSNQLSDVLLVDKSNMINMMNNVSENDDTVSLSLTDAKDYGVHLLAPYTLQILGQNCYFQPK